MRLTRPVKTGDEQDAYTRWRKLIVWKAGEIKAIKRATSRRERRTAKQQGWSVDY